MNRREFVSTSAAAAAGLFAASPFNMLAASTAASPRRLSLNGAWQFARRDSNEWQPATVPGCVHTDLMAAGKIPDPFFGDNERQVQWVGESGWVYRRTFEAPEDILKRHRVLLRCDGLDTLAAVRINGQEIGRADNMFRVWEFDVKSVLKAGANTIEITFDSPLPYMQRRQTERTLYEWAGTHEPRGRAWVRKEPCSFGWDWGPVLITCGIWRDISLVAFDNLRLADVSVLQEHSAAGGVTLQVAVTPEVAYAAPFSALVTLKRAGTTLGTETVTLTSGSGRAEFKIANPELWWPAGMGKQPLYEVLVELKDPDGKVVETTARRIGLRTLKLLAPDKQNPLRLEVNGVAFFAKGANVIPVDAFPTRATPERLRRLAEDAVAVNMNTLRFWGGGYYEDEALFDACDELGLCVWLDFKFACSSYPAFDAAFMESVRREARDQLVRLRHHACIAVWCGNNEIGLMTKPEWSDQSMGKADYERLFKDLLGSQVKELAPQANFVSGSPDCGDVHYWQVWHGDKPFEAYRTLTGFLSEFGFQSFPEPRTVASYTRPEDRASVLSPVMQWHQRSSGNGNERIEKTLLRYFKTPRDFDSTLWLSQLSQAYAIKLGAEHWRRTMPKSMGCLFWQYNDCWPVASWSSVDYFGRWKALHYASRRFYAPVLVSALENPEKKTVEVHVSSDLLERRQGKLSWTVTNLRGESLLAAGIPVEIAPRHSQLVRTLELKRLVREQEAKGLLVWLKLEVDGQAVSENLACLVPPKELALEQPNLTASIKTAGSAFEVEVHCERPALWCWLELEGVDAACSDNFFHLPGGRSARIAVTPKAPMTETVFKEALKVRSLFDLC
jgi:beta-mannosidase